VPKKTAKKSAVKKTGRKLLDISAEDVQKLAGIGANNCEIAGFFECGEATIRRRFGENLTKGRAIRKIDLRRKQYEIAMKGNVTMLIWLGKNELGQSDQPVVDQEDMGHEIPRVGYAAPSKMTKSQRDDYDVQVRKYAKAMEK
jgi:hypothetical protein